MIMNVTFTWKMNVSVRQGSALSPLLFILIMDTITQDIQGDVPWTLLYADDIVLAITTREELQCQVQAWNDRLSCFVLRLNTKKTEYLEMFPNVGTIQVNDDESIDDEVRAMVNMAWLRWREVTGVLCDKKMSTYPKSKIYRTLVRPVALYGS
ncbi:uncharacterized protein [Centruroides vittatus]|uniref:uncharacterized protein n=1 Tax=Centruroides vittatus TaxID=120091 RepID=UPI00350F10EC